MPHISWTDLVGESNVTGLVNAGVDGKIRGNGSSNWIGCRFNSARIYYSTT